MEIQERTGGLAGMSGWLIKNANISIAVDELTQSQSVVCYPDHLVTYQEAQDSVIYLSEDELKLLKKIFRIEE